MDDKGNKFSDEINRSPYRSGRFYSVDNEWYFSVREKEDQGCYQSKLSRVSYQQKII